MHRSFPLLRFISLCSTRPRLAPSVRPFRTQSEIAEDPRRCIGLSCGCPLGALVTALGGRIKPPRSFRFIAPILASIGDHSRLNPSPQVPRLHLRRSHKAPLQPTHLNPGLPRDAPRVFIEPCHRRLPAWVSEHRSDPGTPSAHSRSRTAPETASRAESRPHAPTDEHHRSAPAPSR